MSSKKFIKKQRGGKRIPKNNFKIKEKKMKWKVITTNTVFTTVKCVNVKNKTINEIRKFCENARKRNHDNMICAVSHDEKTVVSFCSISDEKMLNKEDDNGFDDGRDDVSDYTEEDDIEYIRNFYKLHE